MSLREALVASNLPFRVDVSDWATLRAPFRDAIKNNLQRIYPPQNRLRRNTPPTESYLLTPPRGEVGSMIPTMEKS